MRKAMNRYLDECVPLAELLIDRNEDEMVRLALMEARRYSKSRQQVWAQQVIPISIFLARRVNCTFIKSLVSNALKIQAAAYISEIQPELTGGDTLGILPFKGPEFKQNGRRLIPISMDYQLDNLYIQYMQRNLKPVLDGLTRLIYRGKRKPCWYETFLTILVLLCTLESVYASQLAFVRKYQNSVSDAICPYYSVLNPDQVTELMLLRRMPTSLRLRAPRNCP
jgi:hypothetical protein